jgi:hypothetical protein
MANLGRPLHYPSRALAEAALGPPQLFTKLESEVRYIIFGWQITDNIWMDQDNGQLVYLDQWSGTTHAATVPELLQKTSAREGAIKAIQTAAHRWPFLVADDDVPEFQTTVITLAECYPLPHNGILHRLHELETQVAESVGAIREIRETFIGMDIARRLEQ